MAWLAAIRRRPTAWVEVAAAGAWALLLAATLLARGDGAAAAGAGWDGGSLWVCTTGIGGVSSGGLHAGAAAHGASSFLAAAPAWALMTTAMMLPPALPAVRHVGVHSLYWRRRRAMLEFLATFLGIWIAYSLFLLRLLGGRGPTDSPLAPAIALAVAAIWQLTPYKQRALRACHRPSRLPPRGWRATFGTARFGWRHAAACLASCWAMMVAVALTGSSMLLWMTAATAAICFERLSLKPQAAARRLAALLAAAALGVALAALLG